MKSVASEVLQNLEMTLKVRGTAEGEGQFFLSKWKSLTIRLSYAIICNNNMSTCVIFCTCPLFFEFVSQRDTTTKPQCNRVG